MVGTKDAADRHRNESKRGGARDKGYLPSSLLFRCRYCLALPPRKRYAPRQLAVHVPQEPGRAVSA